MTNYNNGKIYKIECLTTGLIYVGSTTKKYLSERLTAHRGNFNSYKKGITTAYTTSFKILENDNYRIDLIEAVNCDSKDELRAREGYHIRALECVNKKIEGRTEKEYKLEYYQKNKTKLLDYYQENKEKILKRTANYRKNNEEKITESKKEKFTCDCGGKYTSSGKSKHKLTKKHIAYLNNN